MFPLRSVRQWLEARALFFQYGRQNRLSLPATVPQDAQQSIDCVSGPVSHTEGGQLRYRPGDGQRDTYGTVIPRHAWAG